MFVFFELPDFFFENCFQPNYKVMSKKKKKRGFTTLDLSTFLERLNTAFSKICYSKEVLLEVPKFYLHWAGLSVVPQRWL